MAPVGFTPQVLTVLQLGPYISGGKACSGQGEAWKIGSRPESASMPGTCVLYTDLFTLPIS
jgi:hypothetical protein